MEKHWNTMMMVPSSPTPTTFVEADTTTFRELVQKLTGASADSTDKLPVTSPAPATARLSSKASNSVDIRRSPFKLQDRRPTMRKLEIKLGLTNNTHLLIQSPLTPLGSDTRVLEAESPEDKAIAEKGFYLHPSPLTTPIKSEPPELLTLFPLTSPRVQQ